jgi:hypothetical protein
MKKYLFFCLDQKIPLGLLTASFLFHFILQKAMMIE